ncbi:hypothetical protein RJ639_033995 [Escallonia herrerae]|uniref:Reverse transcriptase RNase H-like domain-containing protein n=1 Tax=Escallonia herrerae TaxID=1293975 RepID=A0AA88WUS6_9ASTE|nr:hypothetical protein RJ639_033995 [Escallonia herrerae]
MNSQTGTTMNRKMSLGPFCKAMTIKVGNPKGDLIGETLKGGVLMQERYPVAYESRKLSDAERCYTTHEKELLAVVHCLRVYRHYQLGVIIVMRTDNTVVSHFLSQYKLTSKQAKWQQLLAEFNLLLKYSADSTNSIADVLSRTNELNQLAFDGHEWYC